MHDQEHLVEAGVVEKLEEWLERSHSQAGEHRVVGRKQLSCRQRDHNHLVVTHELNVIVLLLEAHRHIILVVLYPSRVFIVVDLGSL